MTEETLTKFKVTLIQLHHDLCEFLEEQDKEQADILCDSIVEETVQLEDLAAECSIDLECDKAEEEEQEDEEESE